ncbi:MAG: autotransporter outer membrane beta-barrel domain-containing protein, partial [Burkholderiaceae bacterium]
PPPPVLYRPDVALLAGAANAVRWIGQQSVATSVRRNDERVQHDPAGTRRWWSRIEAQHLKYAGSGVGEPSTQGRLGTTQIGHTWEMPHEAEFGAYATVGMARLDGSGYARGQHQFAAGRLDLSATGVGSYARQTWSDGGWLGAVAQVQRTQLRARVDQTGSLSESRGWNWIALLEGGTLLALSETLTLEPFAQGSVQGVRLDSSSIPNAALGFSPDTSWLLRGGARLQRTASLAASVWRPYLEAAYWHQSRADDGVTYVTPATTTTLLHTFGGSGWSSQIGARVDSGRWSSRASVSYWHGASGDARLMGGELLIRYAW